MGIGAFSTINQTDWVKPEGWIDISNVANNEINLLVTDQPYGFVVTTSSGTYSIDWGNGVIETGRVSGVQYDQTYTPGTGTPTPYGYTCFRIRIFGATGNITRFQPVTPAANSNTSQQSRAIGTLWMALGTNNLTTAEWLTGTNNISFPRLLQCVQLPPVLTSITNWNQAFYQCHSLRKIIGLDSPWGSVTTVSQMFENCFAIEKINLPKTLPNTITNLSGMFSGCRNLKFVNLPTTWPNAVTSYASMFDNCQGLQSIPLPTSWASTATSFANMFNNCTALISITLPSAGFPNGTTNISAMFQNCTSLSYVDFGSSWGTSAINSANNLFAGCNSLIEVRFPNVMANFTSAQNLFTGVSPGVTTIRTITNVDKLGSLSNQVDFVNFGNSIYWTGGTFTSLISRISINGGSATTRIGLTTLRLTNPSSTYGGASPQINVSFSMMGQAALVNLFNDLPTLTGKTINITGCPGASLLTPAERAIATGKGWTITG